MFMRRRLTWHRFKAIRPEEAVARLRSAFVWPFLRRRWLRMNRSEFHRQWLGADFAERRLHLWFRQPLPWQANLRHDLCKYDEESFSDYKNEIVRQAEQICRHDFELLGLRHSFAEQIDWHYDWMAARTIPVKPMHAADVWSPDIVREVRYVWELNRHQHFFQLAKASALTDDSRFVEELLTQWRHWLASNPPFIGINSISSLEIALRLISWTWTLAAVGDQPDITDDLILEILQSVAWQTEAINNRMSLGAGANNHLIGEATGLVLVGCYFPELRRSKAWREKGFAIVFREFERQVHPDGVLKEQSPAYQLYIFAYGLLIYQAAGCIGQPMPATFRQRLRAMADFLAVWPPEKALWPIGDDDGGEALRLGPYPTTAADLLHAAKQLGVTTASARGDARRAAEWAFWLTGKWQTTSPQTGDATQLLQVHRFPAGGLLAVHACASGGHQYGWLDCGPMGLAPLSAHGHADTLSFWLSNDKEPLLTDGGTFLYLAAGDQRSYFRGCRAHNTIVVDDADFALSGGPFQWLSTPNAVCLKCRHDEQRAIAIAAHDGYQKIGVSVQRRLRYCRGIWSLSDTIAGTGEHRITWIFHLGECRVCRSVRPGQQLFAFKSADLLVHWRSRTPMQTKVICGDPSDAIGWVSPKFGLRVAQPAWILTLQARLPISLITRWKVEEKR